MKQELVDFKDVVSSLQLLSKKVVPLPQRKSKLKGKVLVDPVCSYKNMQVRMVGTFWCSDWNLWLLFEVPNLSSTQLGYEVFFSNTYYLVINLILSEIWDFFCH